MPLSFNVELFRQHYMDVINCKKELNSLSVQCSEESNELWERLSNIIDTFGRETVNKVVANAIQHSIIKFDNRITQWANGVPVQNYLFESDDVMQGYVPNDISPNLLSLIADELILQEKEKQSITSSEGLQMELLMNHDDVSFLSYTNEQKQTIYLVIKKSISPATPYFSAEQDAQEMFLRYQDGLEKYNQYLKYANMRKLLSDKLYGEFQDFKTAMLCKDSAEIFDSAYMITKLQNFHIIVDSIPITCDQIGLLLKQKTVLQDLYDLSTGLVDEQDDNSVVTQYLEECDNLICDEEFEM